MMSLKKINHQENGTDFSWVLLQRPGFQFTSFEVINKGGQPFSSELTSILCHFLRGNVHDGDEWILFLVEFSEGL